MGGPHAPLATATAIIERGLPAPFDRVRAVFVDGFVSFTPLEWRLVEVFARRTELWVGLPAEEGGRADAFPGARGNSAAPYRPRWRRVGCGVRSGGARGTRTDARPAGLSHLEGHLFGPAVPAASDAAGLRLIEAPGPLGEARLVARRIRTLVAAGTKPGAIVVTARELTYSFDLLGEVFAEYGLPVELDGDDAVLRNPAVGTLLRAIPAR